ncbi:thyroid receptor-interacting protein 11-like isoform X1 [Lytechinus variegatus]|uniref:thyroid receptor-interacting protein 11-like isoform X1 n=1 Tax=Lytechinus variegatus TaxID=7654 RepID=UPI001BB29D6E|nr:thyroid receptor-interacting protein 11-like isoform X1 [Lytechinus variegatus]
MAWFGGNLKNLTENLTGQISNVATSAASFTRDVIAEGTEEVADHSTELQISEDKVRRLETAIVALRAENERLGTINGELAEKAEASELQINSISSQYRSLLVEKEDQLNSLIQKQNDMQSFHQNMLSTGDGGMTAATSTSSLSGSAIMMDSHDFDDVISSQQEINRLSHEVGRLRAECTHWKEMAAGRQDGAKPVFQIGDDSSLQGETGELKSRIKSLEENLRRREDESQHELSALQDSHSHKLKTLTKKHNTDVEDYERKIESLEKMIGYGERASDSGLDDGNDLQKRVLELEGILHETRQQVGQLEESNYQLEKENARLTESDRDNTRLVQTLKRKVDILEKDRSRLEKEVKGHTGSPTADGEVANLRKENDELKHEVEHLMKVVNRQETELEVLLGSHEQVREELFATKQRLLTELNASHANTSAMLEDIHNAGRKFSTEEALRRSKLLKEKQEIVDKMITAGQKMSDSKATVATLEAATLEISDQAAEIVSEIGCSQHQEITADFVSSLEKENDLLKHHVSRLQNEIDELNQSCETLTDDKQKCETLITRLNQKVKELSGNDLQGSERRPSDPSQSESEMTLVTGESDQESLPRPVGAAGQDGGQIRRHISYRRPQSPTDSSVASDLSSSMREGWTSETELSSDGGFLAEGKQSLLENSDAVSFDGEYDDSIMFAGIKEKFPEAADAFKQQLNQFEMVRADWEMEKQALEEVVIRMRDQLKERDRTIQDMTAEKGLMAVHKEHVEDLEDRVKTLQRDQTRLLREKETAEKENEEMVEKLNTLEGERSNLNSSILCISKAKDELENKLSEVESKFSAIENQLETSRGDVEQELNRTRDEKEQLESDLSQLDAQHQTALEQIIASRDKLIQEIKDKESEIRDVNGRLVEQSEELEQSVAEKVRLESEMEEVREDLSTSRADLLDSEQMKQEQAVAMTTLRTKLQAMQDEHNELLKEFDEFKRESEVNAASKEEVEKQKADETDLPSREVLQSQILALTDKLNSLQSTEQSKTSPNESVAYLEHELSRTHHEIEELNKSIDERDAKLQELNTHHTEHSKLLEQKAAEMQALKTENEQLQEEIKSRDDVLTKSHGELMKLQADLAAIKSGAERQENAQEQERTLAEQLQKTCDELRTELKSKKELLESATESRKELEELIEQKEEDVRALADENSHYFKNVEKSKDKISELSAKVKELENVEQQLQDTKNNFETLNAELEETKLELKKMSASEEEHIKTLHAYEEEVNNLKKSITQHVDSTRIEKESLHMEEDKLVEELKENAKKIENLTDELHTAELELTGVKAELETAKREVATKGSQLSESNDRIKASEEEIGLLKSQVAALRDQVDVGETSLNAVVQLQKELDKKSAIIDDLQKEVDANRADLESQCQTFQQSIQSKDSEISRLDSSLTQLRSQKESLDESIVAYESQIIDLQRTNQQKDDDVNRLREEVRNITTQLQQPAEQPLQNGEMNKSVNERIEDTLSPSSPFSKSPTGVFQGQDGSISDNEKHYEKIIQERDKEIGMLQHERQSLLTSLNEKSSSTMGNSVLVDLHKNQMKVKTLEAERHQMMTVLNEKTREASNLKNEVHKLLKVISAQKSALEKAQDDFKELHNESRGPRDDMQKEALQKLSRIIQDKDLEIEALKQKNTSLLEVLQTEAPSNSSQISGVLSESEKLQKENSVLKEERDQLVVSIHQKHQESLAYYEEVQRLVGIVNGEVHKFGNLQKQHTDLQTKMDEMSESMNRSKLELDESFRVKGSLEEDLETQKNLVEELENQVQLMDNSRVEMNKRIEELEKLEADKANELGEKISELARLQRSLDEIKIKPEQVIEETLVKPEMAPVQFSSPPVQYEQRMQEKDAEIAELRSQLQLQQVTPPASEDVDSSKGDAQELASVKEQLESQGHALMEMDGLVKDRSMELEKKKLEVATLRQQIDQQDQAILDQNTMLQKQSGDLQQLQVDLKAKTEEANTLRHHTQQISARLQAVEQELARAHQEITNQQHMVHNKDGELRQLQDLMSRTSAEVREKDFEITALQDKCKTLAKLVDERETDVQGEVRRLLGEAEAMQTQAQRFQQERDQAMLALEKCQRDLLLLQEEAAMRGGNEQKLMRELERLRSHLIQMEDTYTQEALQSEEREKELRNRLSTAEEHAHTSSHAVQSASKEASVQIDSLRDQLSAMTDQKDQALMQLAMVQSESEEYILSLNNLQMVLEQFQQEKEASIASEVEVYELKAREKERIAADLLQQNVDLQERLSSAQEALDIASRLSEQLDKKEEAMEKLRAEMHKKEEILGEFQRRFDEVSSRSETKVDKPLVKNLFMNYLSAPQAKKQEMIKVICNVLNFSEEDMHKSGLGSGAGGWLSGFFRRTPNPTPPPTPTKANVSFTQQFVQFLESESTPKRSPRLPVDEMSQDRHHHPTYNPFSAPVPQQSPFIQPGAPAVGAGAGTPKGPGAAHPFLRATGQPATPLGAVQPVIASAGVSAGNPLGAAAHSLPSMPTFAPVPAREGATPGRGSPRGQAAVLDDILH